MKRVALTEAERGTDRGFRLHLERIKGCIGAPR